MSAAHAIGLNLDSASGVTKGLVPGIVKPRCWAAPTVDLSTCGSMECGVKKVHLKTTFEASVMLQCTSH